MCRAAPKRHQLAKLTACAPRHIGAASLDHHPPQLTTGTCARHCSASATQCPASADASLVHHPPPPASARTQASSAALCRRPPQAPGNGTEPLSGPPPATAVTTGTCAGHCSASATQCPARADASLVHHPPPPACARTRASSAALCRRPPQAPGNGTEPLTGPLPATADTTGTCAGHCSASAPQCPANPTPSLAHHPPRPCPIRCRQRSRNRWPPPPRAHGRNRPQAMPSDTPQRRARPSPPPLSMRCRPHEIWAVDLTR